MKHLIIAILSFFCIASAAAQPLTPTYTGAVYGWAQYRGLYGADSGIVIIPTDTFSKSEPVGTMRILSPSFDLYVWTGARWKTFTATGGGGSTDTSSLSARIDGRVKYTDTPALVAPYASKAKVLADSISLAANTNSRVKYTDTAAMLANYVRKQTLNDTAASLRTAIAGATVDTSSLSTRINLRLKYSDTAAMLANLYVIAAGKVKYTDTATMLAPYLRSALGVKYADTANMLLNYARKQYLADSMAVMRVLAATKIDSMRRVGLNVQGKISGNWVTMYTDSVGSGGGGSTDSSLFVTRTYLNNNAWKLGGNTITNANTQYLGSDIDFNFSSYGTFFLMATAGRVRLGGNGNSNGGYNVTMVGGQNNTANGGSNYAVTISGNSNQVSGPFQVALSGINNDLGAGAYSYALGGSGFLGNGKTGVGFEGDNYTTGKKAFLDHQSLKAFYNGYKFWCRTDSLEFDTLGVLRAPYIKADKFAYTSTNASTLSPAVNTEYAFYGSTATYTLPAVTGNSGKWIRIVNIGTGTITVNTSGGGNDLFTTTAAATTTVTAGSVLLLKCYTVGSNTYWKTSQ